MRSKTALLSVALCLCLSALASSGCDSSSWTSRQPNPVVVSTPPSSSAPQPPSQPAPTESSAPTNVEEPAEHGPSNLVLQALAAIAQNRFDDACALASPTERDVVCSWLAARSRGEHPSFPTRSYEAALRARRVHRIRGEIVNVFDADMQAYEVDVAGVESILFVTEAPFDSPGRFSLWVRDQDPFVLDGGRVVPRYLEWPIHEAVRAVLAGRGDPGHALTLWVLDRLEP